jgi:hypothetical protein
MEIKGKSRSYYSNNSRPVKRICKNSLTFKRPNLRIMALKKEKRYKQKGFVIYSTK